MLVWNSPRFRVIASGPTREYIFLRNQLQRDKETIVDVWLQSAGEGISQDAHKILTELPSTPQELFEYDCIVAFDPNWHEAMVAQEAPDKPANTVLSVIQKGYSLNGRLLRPARVIVSKNSSGDGN